MECQAVGAQVLGKPGPYEQVAGDMLWTTTDGKRWVSTVPAKSPGEFLGLSCVDVTTCVVVGIKGSLRTLPRALGVAAEAIETVRGIETRSMNLPLTRRVIMRSVSCTTSGVCNAAGSHYVGPALTFGGSDYSTSNGGTSWTSNPLPLLPAGTRSHVQGVAAVSCLSSTECVAVGGWISPRGFGGYVMSTTDGGKRWTFDRVPGAIASLDAVSCRSDGECVVVGDGSIHGPHSEGTGNGIVLTGRVGGKWTLRAVPRGNYELNGVTCVGETCFAVGVTSHNTDKILKSADGGIKWSVQAVPLGQNFGLVAVSCVTKLQCEAVG
jgi:photosystem II stability/assembly factor-like uncharacterized protein